MVTGDLFCGMGFVENHHIVFTEKRHIVGLHRQIGEEHRVVHDEYVGFEHEPSGSAVVACSVVIAFGAFAESRFGADGSPDVGVDGEVDILQGTV